VINRYQEIVGYVAGNDVSSRSIEGENPLYLPQAKVYDGSCALGPAIRLAEPDAMRDLPITLEILRDGVCIFYGETAITQMKRAFEGLVSTLFRELSFPRGAFLMTGTGIVPGDDFTLTVGDVVRVGVGGLALENVVA
jgi:2-dehydro-3-deoxy-D-arabinonate dehydratase